MNYMLSRGMTLAMLAAGCALAGCKGKDSAAAAESTAAMTRIPDTTAVTAPPAPAPLSDANIAGLVDEVNVADSTLAAAALPKLTDKSARDFAKLMMGEHHGLHIKGLQIEKAQKLTPEVPADDPFKPAVGAEQSALAPLPKGKSYDSTYIAHELGIHQAVLEWSGKNTPQNSALQGYMKSAKDVIQRHIDHALAAQTKLGGGPAS
jgi:predicted outer membrane protein